MSEIDQYDYELPRELIAQHPLRERADARLMVIDRGSGQISHFHVRDLPSLLDPGDCLVFNDSRVLPARLVGFRTRTSGRWQGLYLGTDRDSGLWEVLSKTRGKLQIGDEITLEDRNARPAGRLEVVARLPSGHLAVRADGEEDAVAALERLGRVPLPPYIRDGQMVDDDFVTYQTVFAREPGSVAAPTAGLHFTNDLLRKISSAGVVTASVTLHVGLGTFRPVKAESLDDHTMHSEWATLSASTAETLNDTRAAGGRLVAVGTTSVRTLETAAAIAKPFQPWTGTTDLFIRPPYAFQAVDRLITNFHLPKSTLLVLVSAFAGKDLIMDAYRIAIEEQYRFFSYGDAMLIL